MNVKLSNSNLDEEYPILMQRDFQKLINNLAELPNSLKRLIKFIKYR